MAEDRVKTTVEIGLDDRPVHRLGRSIEEALDTRPVEKFNQEVEKTGRTIERLSETNQRNQDKGTGPANIWQDRSGRWRDREGKFVPKGDPRLESVGAGGAGGAGDGDRSSTWKTVLGAGAGGYIGSRLGAASNQVPGMFREGLTEHFAGMLPIAGPAVAGLISSVREQYQQGIQSQQAVAQTMGTVGAARGEERSALQGIGQQFGMAEPQIRQIAAQAAEATARRGEELQQVLPEMMRLQTFGGLRTGQTGAFLGALGTSQRPGTVEGPEALEKLTQAVGGGISAGLREERLGEYLQQLTRLTEENRRQGIMIDPTSFSQLVGTIAESEQRGLEGESAVSIAQTLREMVKEGPSRGGAMGLYSLQAARQISGEDNYARVAQFIEENPERVMQQMLRNWSETFADSSAEMIATALRNFSNGGFSWTQALGLGERIKEGDFETPLTPEQMKALGLEFGERREREGQGVLGPLRTEAGFQEERAARGRETFESVQGMMGNEQEVLNQLQPLALKAADAATRAGETALREMGRPVEMGPGGTADRLLSNFEWFRELNENNLTGRKIIEEKADEAWDSVLTLVGSINRLIDKIESVLTILWSDKD